MRKLALCTPEVKAMGAVNSQMPSNRVGHAPEEPGAPEGEEDPQETLRKAKPGGRDPEGRRADASFPEAQPRPSPRKRRKTKGVGNSPGQKTK